MSAEFWDPVRLSLWVSFVAACLCVPAGIGFAMLVVRRRFPGRVLLDSFLNIPIVLPPLVTGYFLLLLLGANGPVGRVFAEKLNVRFAFTTTGVVIACFTIAFPMFYRSIKLSLETMDRRIEDVASTLGARRLDVFLTITLPMNWRGIVTGFVLAFARSLGEFGATIIFAANIPGKTRTIPLAVFNLINTPGGDREALPLILIATAISVAAIAVSYSMTASTVQKR